jgi:hypothetical protein
MHSFFPLACGGGGTLIHCAQEGFTALIAAAREGHSDCVRVLLDAGADKNATDKVRASAGLECGPGCVGCFSLATDT